MTIKGNEHISGNKLTPMQKTIKGTCVQALRVRTRSFALVQVESTNIHLLKDKNTIITVHKFLL